MLNKLNINENFGRKLSGRGSIWPVTLLKINSWFHKCLKTRYRDETQSLTRTYVLQLSNNWSKTNSSRYYGTLFSKFNRKYLTSGLQSLWDLMQSCDSWGSYLQKSQAVVKKSLMVLLLLWLNINLYNPLTLNRSVIV